MSSNDVENGATTVRRVIDGWMLKGLDGQIYPISGTVVVGREDSCDITIKSNELSRQHARINIDGDHLVVQDLNSTNGTSVNGAKITSAPARSGDEIKFDEQAFQVIGPEPVSDKTQVRKIVEPIESDHTQVNGIQKDTVTKTSAEAKHTQVVSTEDFAEIENSRAHNANWRQSAVTDAGTRLMQTERPCLVGVSAPYRGKKFILSLNGATVGRMDSNDICLVEPSISSKHATIVDKNGSWRISDCGSSNGTFVNGERVETSPLEPNDKIHFGNVEMLYVIDDGSSYEERITQAESETIKYQKKSMPAWMYAVLSFVIVIIALGYFLFKDKIIIKTSASSDNATLQIKKLWAVTNSANTGIPTTPSLGDVTNDGVNDVVVGFSSGKLAIYDGRDGQLIKTIRVDSPIVAPPVLVDITKDKVVDIIIATQSKGILAYEASGQRIWATQEHIGKVYNRPRLHDVNQDGTLDLIVPTDKTGLVAVDGITGRALWNSAALTKGQIITVPSIVKIKDKSSYLSLADSGQLIAINDKGGLINKQWEYQAPAIMFASPLVVTQGKTTTVVIATRGKGLVAVDGLTGSKKWNALSTNAFFASPILSDVNDDGQVDVVAVTLSGVLYAVSVKDGKEILRVNLKSNIQATPVAIDLTGDNVNDLVLLDDSGRVQIVNPATKSIELVGQIPGADVFIASPVLGDINNDQKIDIVVASQNGNAFSYSLNRSIEKGSLKYSMFLSN